MRVAVQIALKEYLARRERETGEVITLTDIHKNTGVALSTLSSMWNNQQDLISRKTLNKILTYLNSRGVECGIADLLVYTSDGQRVA